MKRKLADCKDCDRKIKLLRHLLHSQHPGIRRTIATDLQVLTAHDKSLTRRAKALPK